MAGQVFFEKKKKKNLYQWKKIKKPPEEIYKLFRLNEVKHHLIAIGTQECCRSILASVVYSSKYEWEMKIKLF